MYDKNGWRSEVALDSSTGKFDIFAGIEVHVELDLSLKGIELFFSSADAANDHDSGDDN